MFNLVALYFINFFCFRACRNFALMICTLINNYNRPLWFEHIPENGCSQRHRGSSPSCFEEETFLEKEHPFRSPPVCGRRACRERGSVVPLWPSQLTVGMSSRSSTARGRARSLRGFAFHLPVIPGASVSYLMP